MLVRPTLHRDYGRLFTDPVFWRPYLEAICARESMPRPVVIEPGLAGTFPVFRVDSSAVIKIFGTHFGGPDTALIERAIYRVLEEAPELPAPRVLAAGSLYPPGDEWHWPYLVLSLLPGRSYGEDRAAIDEEDRAGAARFLGSFLRRLHALPVEQEPRLAGSQEAFRRLLERQREQCAAKLGRCGAVPRRLVDQVDGYLPPIDALFEAGRPALIHADLNQDHLLGQRVDARWTPTGVIDFGDGRIAPVEYEWVALHLGLFHCDKRLLQIFFDSYTGGPWKPDAGFVHRALAMTLLFEFEGLEALVTEFPETAGIGTLEELADRVWNPAAAGL